MERLVIPAKEGRGIMLSRGARFRVVDLEGQQVGDLFAFRASDVSEYLSAEHTRGHVNGLFPRLGESFVTNRRQPILTFESDTTGGTHDMLLAACDPTRYEQLGFVGWHPSCQENLQKTMVTFGHSRIEVPQPVNLFQNTPIDANGALHFLPARTQPGDSVTFRVEMDCLLVVTACSQDILPVNGNRPTALAIDTGEL